ncbi:MULTISPECIES: sensor histidine kinase [Actinomyces]|nr:MULTISPECIES: histidine kinase [Actinomyces]
MNVSQPTLLDVLAVLAMFATFPALGLRLRWPRQVTTASALAALVLKMDVTVGLAAFTTVVRRAAGVRDPAPWSLGGLLWLATTVAVWRDASRASTGNSMLGTLLFSGNDGVGEVPWGAIPITSVLLMAVPVVVGFVLRSRDIDVEARVRAAAAVRQAEYQAQAHARTSTRLADRVDLQEERERVAREVHDGLGHRLSLLAMHAGALEVAVGDPSDRPTPASVQDSARLLREEAQGAMTDLRSLLAVLREPMGSVEPAPRLQDLRDVVDRVLAARQPLSSSIYLERASEADEVLSRAVYRIVQESLTNARKYAPQSVVRLRVEGGPDTGVDITCSNPVPRTAAMTAAPGAVGADAGAGNDPGTGPAPRSPSGGSGLNGMAKRAQICGGTFHADVDERGDFVVSCHLPWRSA